MTKKRYCSNGCKECYIDDKKSGLINTRFLIHKNYIPKKIKFIPVNQHPDMMSFSWEDGCEILGRCKYCSEEL